MAKSQRPRGRRGPANRNSRALTLPLNNVEKCSTWSALSQGLPFFTRTEPLTNHIYQVQQVQDQGTVLTSSITVPTNGASFFTASTLMGQFGSFAAVFDQYRIDRIEAWLIPTLAASANTIEAGLFTSAVDYDNASATGNSGVLQHQNAVATPPQVGHYHSWRPHIALDVYNGSFATGGFANKPSDWIDSSSASVQHYGLLYAISITSAVNTYDLVTRVTCSFRNVV
jgi:hypothetical protein